MTMGDMFHRSDSMAQISSRLIETLDHIERRVELLRQGATTLEQEKGCLIEMLETIQTNKDLLLVSEGKLQSSHNHQHPIRQRFPEDRSRSE